MGFAMLDSFDTLEEAEKYKKKIIESKEFEGLNIIIFDDKDFPELGKRYSVNIE